MLKNSVREADAAHLVHPSTDMRRHEEVGPRIITRGSGVHVYDGEGREYIDGLGGLWSVAVGYSEQRLVDAAVRQMGTLPFYHLFMHKTTEPSALLAEKLASMAPGDLNHVFFTNSGSEANDTAIKIAWYYNNALGRERKKKFISRIGAYHGVTIGAGSLTGLQVNQKGFDLPLDFVRHVSSPHFYRFGQPGESEDDFAARLAAELEEVILAEGPENVAAFIGEPLMGSGGVIVPPRGYWPRIQAICRKHDVLVIADEVITGFGRLGTMFGCAEFDIEPDMMICSKQLTSSYQPLGAVMFSDRIYEAVADYSARLGVFAHGFTASGHPVATAVALENLAIIEERGLVDNARAVGAHMRAGLERFLDHPLVGEVRGLGLIAAVELVVDKATRRPFEPLGKVGRQVFEKAHSHGLITRAVGDSIAFCPPLIITEAEVDEMLRRFGATLDDVHGWVTAGMP